MGQSLTNFADALKHFYTPVIREQLANANILWNKIVRNSDSMVGDEVYMTLHTGRNQGIGARAELADLPTAGQQAYEQVKFPLKYNYGRIQVTGQVIRQSRDNAGAYASALKSEVQGVVTDLKRDLNRQIFGDGTGKLATCASCSTKTFTVDTTKYLEVGMPVDIIVASSGATSNGVVNTTISAVDSATTFTTADAPSSAAGIDGTYAVYRTGSRSNEVMGIGGIVAATGTYLGVNRATAGNEYWQSYVKTSAGSISELMLQTLFDEIEENGGDPAKIMFITTYGVRRAYQSLLTATKRYISTMDLDGGYKALDYNGKPLVVDKDCPAGVLYGLDLSRLTIFNTGEDFTWMDKDGNMLSRVANKDAYEAVLVHYVELACDRCNVQGKISGITEG